MVLWSDSGDCSSDVNECLTINPTIKNKKDIRRHPCTHVGCELVFSRPHRLAAHLRVHTGEKPFLCDVEGCGKSYTNKSHLSRHLKVSHQSVNNIKKYRCTICLNEFSSNQNLKKHELRKHNKEYPFWCSICQIGFKKKNRLASHMFLHTGVKTFKCDNCTEVFSSLAECNKHRRNHRSYKCVCGQIFQRWTEILKHRKSHHAYQEYHCDICKKIFNCKRNIQQHMKIHYIANEKSVFACPYRCPKFYCRKYNLEHHIKSVHEDMTFNCTHSGCSAKLSTRKKLELHMDKHKHPNKTVRLPRQRNKRKDVGQIKRSTAVRLSGVKISFELEKQIILNQNVPATDLVVLINE